MTFEEQVHERKLQKKHNSLIITFPKEIAFKLGLKPGQTLRFGLYYGKVVLTAAGKELTKKDFKELDRYEEAMKKVRVAMEEKVEDDSGLTSMAGKFDKLKLS